MIVEISGSIASGKSTFTEKIAERLCLLGIETVSSIQVITRMYGLETIKNSTIRNIVIDIFLFPRAILSLAKYFKFYVFAIKILFRKPDSYIGAINRLRSVTRKIVVNELITKKGNTDKVVIVDEGTIHSAHNIFVYSSHPLVRDDIKAFANLVPLPDIIVCLSASEDVILNRMLTRKELRLVFEPKELRKKYISRALATFKEICSTENIRPRLLTLDVPDDANDQMDSYIDKVINLILKTNNCLKS